MTDDLGTEYRWRTGQTGGDGTEWHSEWRYVPAPPAAARTLRLSFTADGEPAVDCDLPLDRSARR